MSRFKLIVLLISLTLVTAGCIKIKSSNQDKPQTNNAGIFKTVDKGQTWNQRALIPTTSGKPGTISQLGASALVMDPSDHLALYFGSETNGLFYSYDGAQSWQPAQGLPKKKIQDISVDPNNKCIIYAAIGNILFKSDDCSRTWEQTFIDTDPKLTILSVKIDHFNTDNIFIGTSRGELIRSTNQGESWSTIQRLGSQLYQIAIDPNDSRNMLAVVGKKGLFRSYDRGVSFTNLKNSLKEFTSTRDIKDLALVKDRAGLVFMATGYGMLKSEDYGENWTEIELIPPEKKTDVNAFTVNPENPDEIYYITDNAFYRSSDSGATWTPSSLPTTRAGLELLLDPEEPKTLYLGVKAVPEK